MSEYLYHYSPVEPATWFYLSSLLMIGLFFKFSRFWSVRNLDLVLLILLSPGLLFVNYGKQIRLAELDASQSSVSDAAPEVNDSPPVSERVSVDDVAEVDPLLVLDESGKTVVEPLVPPDGAREADAPVDELATSDELDDRILTRGERLQRYGYLWLFGSGLLWVARLLADPTMVRRPLLEPNLSAGGLTFIGCSLFVFLMANVISREPDDYSASISEPAVVASADSPTNDAPQSAFREGPGYALIGELPDSAKKSLAIFAHLGIVVGIVLIGYRHFDNIVMGIGAAMLYLMLPYTAWMTNEVKHVLPAAALVWAVLWYRKPLVAGIFLGLAGGITYYPLFLLPLWLSFYWPRGLVRFVLGVVASLIVLACVLVSSDDVIGNLTLMFGLLPPAMTDLRGIWDESIGGWSYYYRIPVLAAFVALASSMALWPAQKNLGTLLSCSAAVMVATQFWHGYSGGTNMAWYLPLLLLTIFRPNLEDRVALTVLGEGWLPRRANSIASGRAA